MNFQFSAPVKRFVDPSTSGKPTLKVSPTLNKFQITASGMNKMGAKKGSRINILHNAEAEHVNEAFALVIVNDDSEKAATITVPKNSSRGEFSFSGRYGMMIAMDTQIEFSPEELVEKGILERRVVTNAKGEENNKYSAVHSVIADIADGVETEVEGELYVIYPLVNFRTVDKVSRDGGDDDEGDDEFIDLDEANPVY